MTKAYRYIGSVSYVGDLKLHYFGQQVELTDELAKDAVLGGCAIIPAEEFDELEISDEELGKYSSPVARTDAPEEFKAKDKAAREVLHAFRESLAKGGK